MAQSPSAHSDAEMQYRTAIELARELEDGEREVQAWEKLGNALYYSAHGDGVETAFARQEYGAALVREGDPSAARKQLQAALATYRTFGQTFLAERMERMLKQL